MCGRVWQSRSNPQLQSTMTSLGINEVKQTDEHTGTYCHEFRAGSDKLSETEQEIFLCGKNLSQLQEDEETHTFILSHTLSKVTLWSWISCFDFFFALLPQSFRFSRQCSCQNWPWTPSTFLWTQHVKDPACKPHQSKDTSGNADFDFKIYNHILKIENKVCKSVMYETDKWFVCDKTITIHFFCNVI